MVENLSCQVGCAQGCRFCKTGTMGILRNLHPDEMLAQVVQGIRLAHEMKLPRPSGILCTAASQKRIMKSDDIINMNTSESLSCIIIV